MFKLFKFVFKWALRVFLAVVLLLALVVIFRGQIIKAVMQQRLHAETGLEARIGKLEIGLTSPVIHIEDFRLYNTAEFGGAVFIRIPEIHAEYDATALAARRLRLKLLRFNLAEFNVVRNEAGRTNVMEFQRRTESGGGEKSEAVQQFNRQFDFAGIDTLNLSIGKIRFSDLKTPTNDWTFDLTLQNKILKNVKTQDDLQRGLAFAMIQNYTAESVLDLLQSARGGGETSAEKLVKFLQPFLK